MKKYLYLITIQLCVNSVIAQKYADKKFYLIDSLILSKTSIRDQKIVDSALTKFHNVDKKILKAEAIKIITGTSWDLNIKDKYNNWLYQFILQEIKTNSFKSKENEHKWHKYLATSQYDTGFILSEQGHYTQALDYFLKSIKISTKIKDSIGIGNSLNAIGLVYHTQGQKDKTIEYYFKSLKIREQISDKNGIANSLGNIGYLYAEQNYIDKALTYFLRNLKISEEINNKYEIANTLNNIAFLYKKKDSTAKALEFYNKSLKVQESISNKKGIALAYLNLGTLYETTNEKKLAIAFYKKALKANEEIDNRPRIVMTQIKLGNFYLKQNQLTEALLYAKSAMKSAKEFNILQNSIGASILLDKIYRKKGQWKKAYEMNKLASKISDSIKTNEAEKEIIRKQANYDIDKKNKEIEVLATQNEIKELKLNQNRTFIAFISVALLLILMLIIFIYREYRKKATINNLLTSQNEEKSRMLKEIHHRVKNNLQVVNSLLRLQSSKSTDKNTINMFKETQNRVKSMAKIHEKMYQSGDLKNLNAKEHLSMLINEIVKNYTINTNINLDLDIESINIDAKTMMPLSLIINEMISNSLKYAFKDKENGTITVKLHLKKNIKELIFGDDGIGYTKDTNIQGLGSKLITSFTMQLGGTLEKTSSNGTVFKLTFS